MRYDGLEDKDFFTGDLYKIAKDPKTSVGVLDQLAGHFDFYVRWLVAENPSTSVGILEKLSDGGVM